MNKVVLIGRLTKDVELRYLNGSNTAVATFTLAIDRKSKDGNKETDFIPIVAWNKLAENLAAYTSKGRLISVAGKIQTRSYVAKDGGKRYITEVVCDEAQFLDKKEKSFNKEPEDDKAISSNEFDLVEDEDIPF